MAVVRNPRESPADRSDGERLAALSDRVRPGALAHERLIPVVTELAPLVPGGGLRRGSVIATDGVAATSLALALAARPTADGAWLAVVGMPSLGILAAAELGVAIERLFLVAAPPAGQWAEIVAAVVDGAEIVLAAAPAGVRAADARRVQARVSARGAVLVLTGGDGSHAFQTDLHLRTSTAVWEGIEPGAGRLLARRVTIESSGRRVARPVTGDLLLPGPSGGVAPIPGLAAGAAPTSLADDLRETG